MLSGTAAPGSGDRQPQMRYSTKAQTVESTEPSTIIQMALTGLVGAQALVSMVMMGMGVYFFVQCDPGVGTQYSGVTPLAAAIFLLESMLTGFIHFCCVMRLLSLGVSVLCFLTSSVILVLEIASYKCAGTTGPQFCSKYLRSTNMCSWAQSIVTVDDLQLQTTDTVVASDSTSRLVCVIVALLGLICSIGMLCILSCGVKLGQPVYLAMKRHRTSIVVGHNRNGELACKNKLLNMILIAPKQHEDLFYENRKQECIMQYLQSMQEDRPADIQIKDRPKSKDGISKAVSKSESSKMSAKS